MPFGIRVRGWGVVVEVFAGFSDELFEQFWNGTSSNSNGSSIVVNSTDDKIIWEVQRLLRVGNI